MRILCLIIAGIVLTSFHGIAQEPQTAHLEYVLGAGDLIAVRVFGEEALSIQVRLAEDGRVDYPLLGEVVLVGQTSVEAARQLATLLEECCLMRAEVTVHVVDYQAHAVEVLGAVDRPGPVVLERPTQIVEALSMVGGLLPTAAGQAQLTRAAGERLSIDLLALLQEGDTEGNIYLRGGDVLFVPESPSVTVTGEVRKNGPVTWEEGLTVVEAVAAAGGLTEFAQIRRIQVIREVDGVQIVTRINLKRTLRGRADAFVLQAGDTVWVPRMPL